MEMRSVVVRFQYHNVTCDINVKYYQYDNNIWLVNMTTDDERFRFIYK